MTFEFVSFDLCGTQAPDSKSDWQWFGNDLRWLKDICDAQIKRWVNEFVWRKAGTSQPNNCSAVYNATKPLVMCSSPWECYCLLQLVNPHQKFCSALWFESQTILICRRWRVKDCRRSRKEQIPDHQPPARARPEIQPHAQRMRDAIFKRALDQRVAQSLITTTT